MRAAPLAWPGPVSTVATCDCGAPLPAPPGPPAMPLRSSMGTSFLSASGTLEAQPAASAAAVRIRAKVVLVLWIIEKELLAVEWSPHRFAHIGAGGQEAGLDAAIERGGHQHVASLGLRGIDDELAVGSEARTFV